MSLVGEKKRKKRPSNRRSLWEILGGEGCGPNNYLPVDKCLTKFLSSQYFLESDSKL